MAKVGTQDNPIKLVPDVSQRLLLAEATGIGVDDEGPVTVISKMKEPVHGYDLYLKNLMRNPRLNCMDLRLCFLLFDLFENDYTEATFLLVEKSDYRMSKVGEDGLLYLHDKRQVSTGVEFLEKQSLLEMARKSNIGTEQAGLVATLNKLHSYFYITCTEISEANTASEKRNFDYQANEVLLSNEAELVHIRLNERFAKYDLTRKWRKPSASDKSCLIT